jgi:cellulose synthase/poly-beta-1,6-N-acetylglucosamine synthase-like glycosyltransferase
MQLLDCTGGGPETIVLDAVNHARSQKTSICVRCLLLSSNSDRFTPTCTVVICTRNRPVLLERCLAAVARLIYPRFDVLVVDNAPSNERTREVTALWGANYVVEPVVGLSRARNRGARLCRSEIVAFLDDDAVPEAAWLSGLVREFRDERVMAAAGQIRALEVDAEAPRLQPNVNGAEYRGTVRRVVDRDTASWFEITNFGGVGDGGNMAFRTLAFDLWAGFDERLGRGALLDAGEEHYAFFSLVERGYRVVYAPHAVVLHPYPQTLEDLRMRHLKDLTASAGYVALLFAEHPRHRLAATRYSLEALAGMRRAWRTQPEKSQLCIVPWWPAALARIRGPYLYAGSRLRRRRFQIEPRSGNSRLQPEDDSRQPVCCTIEARSPVTGSAQGTGD